MEKPNTATEIGRSLLQHEEGVKFLTQIAQVMFDRHGRGAVFVEVNEEDLQFPNPGFLPLSAEEWQTDPQTEQDKDLKRKIETYDPSKEGIVFLKNNRNGDGSHMIFDLIF